MVVLREWNNSVLLQGLFMLLCWDTDYRVKTRRSNGDGGFVWCSSDVIGFVYLASARAGRFICQLNVKNENQMMSNKMGLMKCKRISYSRTVVWTRKWARPVTTTVTQVGVLANKKVFHSSIAHSISEGHVSPRDTKYATDDTPQYRCETSASVDRQR